jgi:hypothetical protein
LPVVPALLLLLIRGVALWIVIPVTVLVWLVAGARLRRRAITLAQFLGWVDLNLVALIERSVLRPFVSVPMPWSSAKEIPTVTHRISLLDAA